jgi:hypothetical protein
MDRRGKETSWNELDSRLFSATSERVLSGTPTSLEITVVFTTVRGTIAALKRAGHLACDLGTHIRLLIPQLVPYPLPLEKPPVPPAFRARKFWTLCARGLVDTRIEIQLCRDRRECLRQALPAESLVVLGGAKRLWPTQEQRLARELQRAGHSVLLVADK